MSESPSSPSTAELLASCKQLGAREAAEHLAARPPAVIADVFARLLPTETRRILRELPAETRALVLAAASPELVQQWEVDKQYPEDSVGRLMEPPIGVFAPQQTVGEVIEELREIVKRAFITYGFVVDGAGRLVGVITMRDLLFNDRSVRLESVMLRNVFALQAAMPLLDAMRSTLDRHYPVYPVVDSEGKLVGLVRGQQMFEQQAIELSAQAGSMVGVEKEERLSTPWKRSLLFRHPWLQLNLLTAFVAAAVVGLFENTLEQIVLLAVFLPVLAGQSGNTGCQALAVTLRGMTLGEFGAGSTSRAVFKEALLGFLNGVLVGLTAGIGMYVYARMQGNPDALMLAAVTLLAMTGACAVSGVSGVLVPTALKRFGADPATASSIFLTTATDVVSMGAFLGLATLLLL
ncbi:magnesium transporter [Congregicoccus parvus]|uniref:magnesium transporter n=1 Tax=Congregicoccus parvus TaxID=3081749 RepID=UPI003FA5C349